MLIQDAGLSTIANLDKVRYAKGANPTAVIRLAMQKAMQSHAAVFRTEDSLIEGVKKMDAAAPLINDIHITDRSMTWYYHHLPK